MTIQLGKVETAKAIDVIRTIIEIFVMRGVTPAVQADIREHLAWMASQTGQLNVDCKLETVPELELTKINLTVSFKDLPPLRVV